MNMFASAENKISQKILIFCYEVQTHSLIHANSMTRRDGYPEKTRTILP